MSIFLSIALTACGQVCVMFAKRDLWMMIARVVIDANGQKPTSVIAGGLKEVQ